MGKTKNQIIALAYKGLKKKYNDILLSFLDKEGLSNLEKISYNDIHNFLLKHETDILIKEKKFDSLNRSDASMLRLIYSDVRNNLKTYINQLNSDLWEIRQIKDREWEDFNETLVKLKDIPCLEFRKWARENFRYHPNLNKDNGLNNGRKYGLMREKVFDMMMEKVKQEDKSYNQ